MPLKLNTMASRFTAGSVKEIIHPCNKSWSGLYWHWNQQTKV
jgi:hypothetical protein